VDQIAARIAGTALKVGPGSQNKGIFIRITKGPGAGETYKITHPTACVNGILRGSFYATVTESVCYFDNFDTLRSDPDMQSIITCSGGNGEQLRAIIEYKEEVSVRQLVLNAFSRWIVFIALAGSSSFPIRRRYL
jgi:hypothetical protein